jgi:hypothetical protein
MRGVVAESELKKVDGNHYLVRYSVAQETYMLSVKSGKDSAIHYYHFTINTTSKYDVSEYEIKGAEYKFLDFSKLLRHYEQNPISHEFQHNIGKPLHKGNTKPLIDKLRVTELPPTSPISEGVPIKQGKLCSY